MGLWFKRKRYGWGWTPSTWQGWLVILIYALVVFGGSLLFAPEKGSHEFPLVLIAVIGLPTVALIVACWLKGEKPRWSWGDED